MNKDLDERLIPPGQYRDGQNIGVSTSEDSNVGSIENMLGNTQVGGDLSYLSSAAKSIGAIANPASEEFYWFVKDTNFDYILRYNEPSNSTAIILKDTAGRVLKFDSEYVITGVNIIGDLLFWTDNLNPPRRLNILKYYAANAFTEDDISVIVKPPLNPPSLLLENTTGVLVPSTSDNEVNNISEKYIRFAYRWRYENNEYSSLSPFSATAFAPTVFGIDYNAGVFTSMQNGFNQVKATIETGDTQVTDVQFLFFDEFTGSVYVIETFDKAANLWSDNSSVDVTFNNNKIYSILSADEVTRLFDNVPRKAQSQEIIGSRLVYGNYTQGYNIHDSLGDNIAIDFNLILGSITNQISNKGVPSFKSDRDYEAGIVYLDDYGRMSTVLTPNVSNPNGNNQSNTAYISSVNSNTINDLRVYINHRPPQFASKFRIYLKQSRLNNYSTIFPLISYRSGNNYYFYITRSDVNKVEVDSFIYMKSANGIATNSNRQYKVLEVEVKEENFLGGGEIEGLYFKISDNKGAIDVNLFDVEFTAKGGPERINGSQGGASDYLVVGYTFGATGGMPNGGPSEVVGQIDYPCFYGASTSNTRVQIKQITQTIVTGSPLRYHTSYHTNALRDGRIKIEFTTNNTFKVSNFEDGIYVLWEENLSVQTYSPTFNGGSGLFYNIDNPPPSSSASNPSGTQFDFGFKISLTDGVGYNPGDYIIINVHSADGLNLFGVSTQETGIENSVLYNGQQRIDRAQAITCITAGNGTSALPCLTNPGTQPNTGTDPFWNFNTADKRIRAGALIEIDITEVIYRNNARNEESTSSNTFYSNSDYANIEEWFYEEGIWNSMTHRSVLDSDIEAFGKRIFFKKTLNNGLQKNIQNQSSSSFYQTKLWQTKGSGEQGQPWMNGQGLYNDWAFLLTNSMTSVMFVRSNPFPSTGIGTSGQLSGGFAGDDNGGSAVINLETRFRILQSDNGTPKFETKPTEVDTGIFYEMPYTFDIDKVNNAHIGNQQSQYNGNPAIVSLNQNSYNPGDFTTTQAQNSAFNCFSFKNGIEATRIKGQFNSPFLTYSPRASTNIEDYSEEHLPASLTYSGVFVENTNVNNLNEFNLSLGNFKDVNKEFGPIQKLYSRDTDLVLFQEDKVSRVLYGKNLLSDSIGGGSVASIPQVLGTQITYTGEYGISENPESFASWGNNMYFTDAKRGAVLQLGLNGIFEISNLGMNDYFKDLFRDNLTTQKIGAMDPFKEQYVLSSNNTPAPPCDFSFSANFVPQIGKSGSTETLEITSSKAWTITAIDTGSGVNWITFNGSSPSYGNSRSEIVTMVFQANTTTSNRFFQLQISGCGSSTTNINFTQSGQGTLTTGVIGVGNTNKGGRVAISSNENRQTGSLTYDFTSNTSGAFASIDQQMLDDSEAFISGSTTGIEGFGRNPSTGDNVTLTASRLGAVDRDAFDPTLGTKMYYLLTNNEYLQSQTEEIIANPSTVELTPVLTGDNWTGTITNFSRAGFDHFYTLIDYRGKITAGATSEFAIPIQTNTAAGNITSRLDFGDKQGRISLPYTPVSGSGATGNIFNIRQNGTIIATSGDTPTTASGNLIFTKEAETVIYDAEIIHYGEGENITGEGINKIAKMDITNPALTEFTYESTESVFDTTASNYVCRTASLPLTTKYHNGETGLPEEGNIIYENSNGTVRAGDGKYHRYGSNTSPSLPAAPLNYYMLVDTDGIVEVTQLCTTCPSIAIPVVTIPSTVNMRLLEDVRLSIQTTNDPIFYNVVGTCNNIQVTAGPEGATITWVDCQSISRSAAIGINGEIFIETIGSTYVTTSGTTTSLNAGTLSSQYLPSGLTFNQDDGVILGAPQETGNFTLVFNAENCFGTSIDKTVVISVIEEGQRAFKMDGSQFGTTSALTCNIAAGQLNSTLFYHSGSAVYPQVNDIVSVPTRGQGGTSNTSVFKGGYVWYKAPWDTAGTGNGTALLIDDRGVIVEIYTCPS
jgi:hypothetical protein